MRRDAGEGRLNGVLERANAFRARWRDASLTALLIVQVITIFGVVPAAAAGFASAPGLAAVSLAIAGSLTVTLARGRWTLAAGLGTLALTGLTLSLQVPFPGLATRIASEAAAALAFLALGVVVFGAAFGPGRINSHRIRGAIALYLNLGLLFGFVYHILAEAIPGAYSNLPDAANLTQFRAALDYFSFTTLTSLGFGDIVPIHPVARSLATLEAMLGQMFPATLLARIVTLETASRLN